MNLNEVNFRELDRKWIIFDKSKDIKSIYKKLKIKKDINPVLAYVYISHDDGIQIKILGNVIKLSLSEDISIFIGINIRPDESNLRL